MPLSVILATRTVVSRKIAYKHEEIEGPYSFDKVKSSEVLKF